MEAHRVEKCQGYHIFWTTGSQTAVSLSALCTDCLLTPHRVLVVIPVRDDPMKS
jgi:hypothetical protein